MYRQYAHSPDRIQDAFIDGRACKKLTIHKGDHAPSGNTIAGIDDLDRMYEGRNSKWNFGIYIPSGVTTPEPYKIAGIHSQHVKNKELDFHIYGDQIRATVNWYIDGEVQPSHKYYTPVLFDQWMDMQVSYLMTKSNEGKFTGYLNGKKWLKYKGPTLFPGDKTAQPGQGPWTQLCLYDNHMPVDTRTIFVQMQPALVMV